MGSSIPIPVFNKDRVNIKAAQFSIKPRLRSRVRYEGYKYNKGECLCSFIVSNHIEIWY